MRALYLILLSLAYCLLSLREVSLEKYSDVGRLLTEGRLIWAGTREILHQNYFSFAEPASTFINHHWATAVLFHLLRESLGLAGLSLVYVALGAIAAAVFLREAEREAGMGLAFGLGLLAMPMLAVRAGLRPEVMTLVMLAAFLWVLRGVAAGRLATAWLWLLPLLGALWANLHPGFALGPVIFGAYLLAQVLEKRSLSGVASWAAPFALTCVSGILNPNGVSGWLFPATVGGNYAVPVQENESVFRLQSMQLAIFIEITFVILAVTTAMAWRKRAKTDWGVVLFALAAGVMSLLFFRIYVFFAGVALVAICANIRALAGKADLSGWRWGVGIAGTLVALLIIGLRWNDIGLGERPGDGELAAFLRTNGIEGRLFNNYASGGYHIFHFPDRKVFIDSRPEAYSGDFVREYLTSLTDEDAWHRTVEKYSLDVISFTQFNANEGAFLVRRLRDPDWAAIRLGAAPVLVRRTPKFASLIQRFAK